MVKKSAEPINFDVKRLERLETDIGVVLKRHAGDRKQLGKLLCEAQALLKDTGTFVEWLETKFAEKYGLSRSRAYHYMDAYRGSNPSEFPEQETKKEGRPKGSGSGRPRQRGGRGRGGGKGTTTDSVAAAATSPANPTPAATPRPRAAGQEGAGPSSTPAPSAPVTGRHASYAEHDLDKALARIKELEEAQAVLMETNRDLARQLEAAEATQVAEGSEKRPSDLLEKLRAANQRIDELQSELTTGYDQSLKKRLDNQAKLIEDLRASEKEQRRVADAAKKPGPRGLGMMFQLMVRGDKMEFIRSIASFDDPSPGADDADKVGWIDHIFKKIHSPQMKRDLLGNLSGGELADVLAKHATSITPTSERKPVDYRRLAEPGALSKDNQFGKKTPNGRHPA